MDELLAHLLQQEDELEFSGFDENTAWRIGSMLVERARLESLPVVIDITHGERQLFHASLPGAAADNDEWVKRKVRLVKRFAHSSFYMGQFLQSKGQSIEDVFLIPESEYAPHGGCFPIKVRGTGMVGTITVSGLPQEEDHRLVVETMRAFLAGEK